MFRDIKTNKYWSGNGHIFARRCELVEMQLSLAVEVQVVHTLYSEIVLFSGHLLFFLEIKDAQSGVQVMMSVLPKYGVPHWLRHNVTRCKNVCVL